MWLAIQMQFKWGKNPKTCWYYQVSQSVGQISYSKFNLMAKNGYFLAGNPNMAWIDQNICIRTWNEPLFESKLIKIFKWDQVRQLEYQIFFFTSISLPKNTITYTVQKFGQKNASRLIITHKVPYELSLPANNLNIKIY